jgi:hypothetical protein
MDRKVLIRQDGYEGPLDLIEEEVLLNAEMFDEVRKWHYVHALNSAPNSYLLHFIDDPFAISFSALRRLDGNAGDKRIDDLYGPEL